jgi:7,8-dihydroneopterin aldolase/epimerase/oxygenase
MDKIIAKGLTFRACHGVGPQEKIRPQTFLVDLELGLDLSEAGHSDQLDHTIDYHQAYRLVEHIMTGKVYNLIESLAEEIAALLLTNFHLLEEVEVTVYKPEAPVQAEFEYFAVKIRRRRK